MDPITSLIVTAVALGAATGLTPTAEQAIKDAYAGFKQVIIDRYNANRDLIQAVESLDEQPDNAQHHATLETELIKAGATKDPVLIEAANTIHIAGAAHSAKKKILGKRLQRKLKEVEARENQIDLTLDEGDKIILEEKAEIMWAEIAELENELTNMK